LKPDVCRRVVGRLPSQRIPISLQKPFGFQQRGWRHHSASNFPEGKQKFMVVYLVRSFRTYARIRSLTTGTFNLVVKDRIAFRLSGAHPGLDGPACLGEPKSESGCPRNSSTISSASNPVNLHIPQHFHVFSTREICSGLGGSGSCEAQRRATIWPSAWIQQRTDESAQAF
jgi:hypothetical protein